MTEPVGLGIVGLGRWSNAHAAAAARSAHVRFVSCFSRTESRRDAFASEYGLDRTATSYNALLEDPGVEAVVVSTPNDLHASQILAALDTGKPVLVDKPLSVDVAEGLEILRAVRTRDIPVGVAHHARRLAGHRAAKQWIESGDAGTVRVGYGDFSNNRAAHMRPDAWHRTAKGSEGGVLIQVGIHQVDTMLDLLGPPRSVNARFTYDVLGPTMPDAAAVTIGHASGALSAITCSWTTPSHYRTDLLATGGNLEFTLDHGHWTSGDVDDHGTLELDPPDGPRRPYPTEKGDPLRAQLDELGRAARDGTPMTVDGVAGLRAVAVVEASVRSAAEDGAPVSIPDLVRGSGGSDDEARLLAGLP
jgi:UDP-N-acetyl-2-amino-2-deoxyglucuronate dehydrogenase